MVGFLIFGKFSHEMKNLISCILFLFFNQIILYFSIQPWVALQEGELTKISALQLQKLITFGSTNHSPYQPPQLLIMNCCDIQIHLMEIFKLKVDSKLMKFIYITSRVRNYNPFRPNQKVFMINSNLAKGTYLVNISGNNFRET